MQRHVAVAHLALDLGFWHERGDAIHDQHIDGIAAHQGLGNLERLFPGVRLGDQELVDVDPDGRREARVERMLYIDIGGLAASSLCLGDDVLR